MKIKIQIKSVFGKVLFEYEKEDNTIKKTLEEAIKSSADLRSADLRSANLRSANLSSADLRSADLRYADLRSANLSSADLSSADISYANLSSADLSSADLRYADLRYADLSSANLRSADLSSANLRYADFRYANLRYADLKKIEHLFAIIPMEGAFIAYKKLRNNCIAKIEIPAKSPRTYTLIGRKCRAKYVKTLDIIDSNGNKIKEMNGIKDANTYYKVGRLTYSDKWDNNKLVECTHGIHFFITKQEALEW